MLYKGREYVPHKKDFKKVGYRIFVINSISMPRGLLLIRIFFFSKSIAFLFAHQHIFDYFYKNMDGNPTRDVRARCYLERDESPQKPLTAHLLYVSTRAWSWGAKVNKDR